MSSPPGPTALKIPVSWEKKVLTSFMSLESPTLSIEPSPFFHQNHEDQSTRHQEKEKESFHKFPPVTPLETVVLSANKLGGLLASSDCLMLLVAAPFVGCQNPTE
jgi:hypothetical protein